MARCEADAERVYRLVTLRLEKLSVIGLPDLLDGRRRSVEGFLGRILGAAVWRSAGFAISCAACCGRAVWSRLVLSIG